MSDLIDSPLAPPPGAMCGQHPQRDAVLTCTRCGDFACSECASTASDGLCPTCFQRRPGSGLALNRDTWGIENVVRHAWRTLIAQPWSIMGVTWAMLLPLFVVLLLPILLAMPAFRSGTITPQDMYSLQARMITMGASIVGMLLASPLLLGLLAYSCARVEGRRVGFEVLPAQLGRVGQYAMLLLVTYPIFMAFSLLQQTPDLEAATTAATNPAFAPWNILVSMLSWPLVLVQYMAAVELVVDHDTNAIQALKRAAIHLRHRPFRALFTTFLIGIAGTLSFACCFLPALFFAPLSLLAFTTMYLAMRTPSATS